MKFKLDIFNIILIALIILLYWLYASKSPDITIDNSKEIELLEVIKLKDLKIKQSDAVIDSINNLLEVSIINQDNIKEELINLNTKYDEEINHIDNQFINADIKFFSANYISDSTNNKR